MPNFDNALRTLKGTPSWAHPKGHTQRAHGRQAGKPAAGVLAVLTLACLGLTACGGSSGSSTNAAATGAAATSTAGGSTGTTTSTSGSSTQGSGPRTGSPRSSAIRECLQKNGVTLPTRTPGSGGTAGGGGAFRAGGGAGGPQLPKGMTRAQFEAALKKCGGGNFGRGFGRPSSGPNGVNNPVFRQALAKYAECLRQNGVNIPAPNTSGKGSIFSTKGLNPSSPQFRAATMKCRGTLIGAFRRKP
jgi:hypothetical protein